MGSPNKLIQQNLTGLFRRSMMDIAIYAFIEGQLKLVPTLSLNEAATSFMVTFKISEDEFSHRSILQSHLRTRKAIIEDEKTDN